MTTHRKNRILVLSCALGLFICGTSPARSDDTCTHNKSACVDWKRLSLNTQQTQQVEVLQQDWNTKYMRLQPQIVTMQRKLKSRFADPNADPLEIMQTQQSLARLQEELRNEATANYLRKRALLNDNQQRQLESMMHQLVVERQAKLAPPTASDEQNAGLMNIIHKVKWAIEPH